MCAANPAPGSPLAPWPQFVLTALVGLRRVCASLGCLGFLAAAASPRPRLRAPVPVHRRPRHIAAAPSLWGRPRLPPCCHPRWALGLPVGWACALPWPAPRTPAPLASPPSPLRARIFSPRRPRAPCPSRVHCVLPVVAHGPCLRCCPTRTAHRAWASVLCQRAYRVGLYACGSAARAPRVEPVHPCHAPVATVRAAHTCV